MSNRTFPSAIGAGKQRRARRLFGDDGRAVLIALDHAAYMGSGPPLGQPMAERVGLPVMAEMIPGGFGRAVEWSVENISKAARLGAELGADIIKTVCPQDPAQFAEVVAACPVPEPLSPRGRFCRGFVTDYTERGAFHQCPRPLHCALWGDSPKGS